MLIIPPNAIPWSKDLAISSATVTELAAAAEGRNHYLTAIHWVNRHATQSVRIEIRSGTTRLGGSFAAAAGGGAGPGLILPGLITALGEALNLATLDAGVIDGWCSGYTI